MCSAVACFLSLTMVILGYSSVSGQQTLPPRIAAALAKYEAAEQAAPKDFPLLRKRLDGTKWSWERYGRKTGITLDFYENGTYSWHERGNERGIEYRTVSPHSVLHGDGQGQFIFDYELTKFIYIDLKKDTVRTGKRIP
ncbi:hypothetical protein [Thalassoroseus pseudoceratinae]|uniref:hypothetical protein n=1 Tax=Thalassoroseus pseudoceratinae TaxID=2713176 RepID=UPI00141F49E0|nr:hypothetical protein [Thalassoroseus pseudoceratinae]